MSKVDALHCKPEDVCVALTTKHSFDQECALWVESAMRLESKPGNIPDVAVLGDSVRSVQLPGFAEQIPVSGMFVAH
jgi:hypothetical protein